MKKREITGIVLAGGKSSRFGSDKSMAVWNGKTLLENAINILKPICDKVVISSNNPDYESTGCEVWPDELPIQASMIGAYSCLKRSETEINLVLSCDMPLIPALLFEYLLTNSSSYDAIVPTHNNIQVEPLCGVYKKSIVPVMDKYIKEENYSLQKLIENEGALKLPININLKFFHKNLFANVNTLEDFQNLNHD